MIACRSANARLIPPPRPERRRGAVLVLVAILLVVLLGCTALCIDIGWTSLAKSELQNAADASASAGAAQLLANYSAYNLASSGPNTVISTAQSSAQSYCVQYAAYNKSGDVSSITMLPGDIQFGFADANGNVSYNTSSYPNTVQVLARRDSMANAALPMFFAPVIGTRTLNLSAGSAVTVYSGLITSFNPNGGGVGSSFNPQVTGGGTSSGNGCSGSGSCGGGSSGSGSTGQTNGGWGSSYGSSASGSSFDCKLLPIAFDINEWTQFFASGVSPDGTIHYDSKNVPQIQVYPSPKNSPGNFGLLCIGPWTNATPDYSNWILNGPSASDLQALINAGSFPVSQSSPKPWKGSPGLRSTLSSYFAQIIGKPRLLPLFQPTTLSPYQAASGSGSNTTYSIVGFVGVKVSQVTGNGGNLNISVQPCDVIDPTAVFDSASVYPLGTAPASQLPSFAHPAPRFTK